MNEFDRLYAQYLSEFEAYANEYAKVLQTTPSVLGESMQYSLLNGGKRIRPVLMLACADVLRVEKQDVLPFALALEMIHVYSLIHDDLPAMDNDDFRRGKPSNHKVYGEAYALMAGNALLNEAYAICFKQCEKGNKFVLASRFLNECAGIQGMLLGQVADMYFSKEEEDVSEKNLFYIYEYKTGKLLLAPVVIPGILSNKKCFFALEKFGKLLGQLFQITDDILDVTGDFTKLGKTIGKDEKENKLTSIRLYGLKGAKIKAEECAKDCLIMLEGIEGETQFLKDLVEYVLRRSH